MSRLEWDPVHVPTVMAFMNDDSFIRYLQGPFGSGKSVGCVQELVKRAAQQVPDDMGIRRTRFAVIRNTYRQLEDTTIRTFLDWYPDRVWGRFKVADNEYEMRYRLPDDTIVECDILFRALDRPDQVGNLLSLEITGAWCNEMREMPKQIFDALQGRVGRYPPQNVGGCTWSGIWGDSNPPDTDHWIFNMFEEQRVADCKAYYQPSGLSDKAENVKNLPPNYYKRMMKGKDPDYIKVYIRGEYGYVREGKPVYPEYRDEVHCDDRVYYDARYPVYRGWDFGRTPSVCFGQLVNGHLLIFDELVSEGTGIENFAKAGLDYQKQNYPDAKIEADYGDPSGGFGTQVDEQTVFTKLWDLGIHIMPADAQDPEVRQSAVKTRLSEMRDGKAAFMISPKCVYLRKGFIGGYAFKRVNIGGGERYTDKADKNKYSHVHDALQYLVVSLFAGYFEQNQPPPRVVGAQTRGY